MNLVSYHLVNAVNPEDNCDICKEPLENEAVVAHTDATNGGEHHPVHLRCMRTWAKTHETCIYCRADVNVQGLYQPMTLREKAASYTVDVITHPHFKYVPFCASLFATIHYPSYEPTPFEELPGANHYPGIVVGAMDVMQAPLSYLGRGLLVTLTPGCLISLGAFKVMQEYLEIFGGFQLCMGNGEQSKECRLALSRMGLLESVDSKVQRLFELFAECFNGYNALGTVYGGLTRISDLPNYG